MLDKGENSWQGETLQLILAVLTISGGKIDKL
jgi:hypothetical protein